MLDRFYIRSSLQFSISSFKIAIRFNLRAPKGMLKFARLASFVCSSFKNNLQKVIRSWVVSYNKFSCAPPSLSSAYTTDHLSTCGHLTGHKVKADGNLWQCYIHCCVISYSLWI